MATRRPSVLGIHHLKLAVSNLSISIAWYERVLGARHVHALDHSKDGARFAAVVQMPCWNGLFLELRQNRSQAVLDKGRDLVTMSVSRKDDLVKWEEWLTACGTRCSGTLVGIRGWILVFEDPDGRRYRLYTKEEHGGKLAASPGKGWLDEQ